MYLDIIIFAALAAFLIHRLRSVLGTRHGSERKRQNPFAQPGPEARAREIADHAAVDNVIPLAPAAPVFNPVHHAALIDPNANADDQVGKALAEIAAADATFDPASFVQGAQGAFEMIVTAFATGDRDVLRDMLSPKLFADFEAAIVEREKQNHTIDFQLHRIKSAYIHAARQAGTMSYITVLFDVEESRCVRDAAGAIVEGDADRVIEVKDIWTFTRDVRSDDPNWLLIETRSADTE